MWLLYLLLIGAVIGLSYTISFCVLDQVLTDHGFVARDDGKYHHVTQEDQTEPTFAYCLWDAVVEAFQVGSEHLPIWAVQDDRLDVVISQSQHVVIHFSDGTTTTVPEGDWVIRYADNVYSPATDDAMQSEMVKIELEGLPT